MQVGIMADTHDRLPLIDRAVAKMNEKGVELVLHAGDFNSPFVVSHFKLLKAKLIGVYGNNDAERETVKRKFYEFNAEIRGRFAQIKVGELKIAMTHGEEEELLQSLIGTRSYDLIVHGHTHEVKNLRIDGTLVVNPGEVCGYLTGNSTVALLNTETLEVDIVYL